MQLALGLSANIQQVQALSLNISTTIQSRPVYRESKGFSAIPSKGWVWTKWLRSPAEY